MGHSRSAKDAGIGDSAMPAYLQEAAADLEAKLTEFITSSWEPPDSLKMILDRSSQLFPIPPASTSEIGGSICRHKCECHRELMNPSRWGKLPNKLLFQIFAHLPLPKIVTLQILSHHWKAAFADDAESDFLQKCDELRPTFGLLTRDKVNKFWVRLLDVKFNTWHTIMIEAGHAHAVDITAASEDGGLVCFHSSFKKSKTKIFLVDVVNPLTQRACALPPLHDFNVVQMVQMMVNPETKHYRVLVVGKKASGNMVAKLYDQSISLEKWIDPTKEKLLVFGYGFHWGNFRYNQKRDSPCAYDFAAKRFQSFSSPVENTTVKSLALQGDRVFVLMKDNEGPITESEALPSLYIRPAAYYIVEFRLELGAEEEWVQVRSHRCRPFESPPKAKYDLSLFACKGFLMVLARLSEDEPYRNEVGWSYNLATRRWSDLPTLPGDKPFHVDDLMCRLHWNISV